ncbi:MAG TPA: dihydroneopterin aldolase [Verrucomicrobiae bacterium]
MDQINIEDLEVFCHVGVPAQERAKPQRLLLTIQLEHDFAAAAKADDLERTIDYFALSRRLLVFGQDREWKLIETLAVDLAVMILREFKPARVTVEVKKFVLPESRWVSVRVIRPE